MNHLVRQSAAGSSWSRSRWRQPFSRDLLQAWTDPKSAELTDGLVAERIDTLASSQRVGHQGMQALHPVGHSARGNPRDLRHWLEPFSVGEVLLMGMPVRRSKITIIAQPSVHLSH